MVTGPRQVGKTTTLRRLAENPRHYVSLDNPDARLLANTEPGLFLQRYEPPVLIDEIQYEPQLLRYIKMQVGQLPRPVKGPRLAKGSIPHTALKVCNSPIWS